MLLALNLSPNFHRMNGAGNPSPTAINPNTELPHPYPNALYIAGANSGNPKPASDLNTVVDATALAAYL